VSRRIFAKNRPGVLIPTGPAKIVMSPDPTSSAAWLARRLAVFPAYAVLGIALPISFLTWVERYLYYIRPLELIPTYGTAWLLLAALIAPISMIFWLALHKPTQSRTVRNLRRGVSTLLIGVAATAIVGALATGTLLWLRSFGLLTQFDPQIGLAVFSLCTGASVAFAPRAGSTLLKLYALAKYGTLLGAFSLLSLPFFGWSGEEPAESVAGIVGPTATSNSKPHILLVTIDTLSAESMSLYGAARHTTPNLEAFARHATTFDRAYANANFTTASISSILTGTRPWTHRALQLPGWPIAGVRSESLPALLSHAGYQTGYIGTNAWAGATRTGFGAYFDFGRDRSLTLSACHDGLTVFFRYDCVAAELPPFRFIEMLVEKTRQIAFDRPPNWHFDPRPATRSALGWLAATDKSTPIFLWVHLMPPHAPYPAPAPWLGQFDSSREARREADSEVLPAFLFAKETKERAHVLQARYDESVKYVDYFVGEFLKDALPLLGDNTAVIITSDHGESFAHGYGTHTGPGLFESILHIPLVMKFPRQTHAEHAPQIADQVDIAPTLADLAGIHAPQSWEGRSLLRTKPWWQNDTVSQADATIPAKIVFAMNFEQNRKRSALTTGSVAALEGHWKLVHYMGKLRYRSMPQLHDALYDLSADPGELTNRISDQPDEAEHLLKLIAAELDRHGGPLP